MAEQLGQRRLLHLARQLLRPEPHRVLGLEPDGMLRVGMVHYNTLTEVERFLEALMDSGRSTNALKSKRTNETRITRWHFGFDFVLGIRLVFRASVFGLDSLVIIPPPCN